MVPTSPAYVIPGESLQSATATRVAKGVESWTQNRGELGRTMKPIPLSPSPRFLRNCVTFDLPSESLGSLDPR